MKVALVWDGDRSSAFSYDKVKEKFDVSFLLTFLRKDPSDAGFLFAIKRQCEKIGVPFFWAKMKTTCPEEYRETIVELKEDFGIEGIITNATQGSIEDACRASGMRVIRS